MKTTQFVESAHFQSPQLLQRFEIRDAFKWVKKTEISQVGASQKNIIHGRFRDNSHVEAVITRGVPNLRFGLQIRQAFMGSVRLGRFGKPNIDSASIPNLFQKRSSGARLYPKSMQQGPRGVAKRVVKIQSVLLYDQPFPRYSLIRVTWDHALSFECV